MLEGIWFYLAIILGVTTVALIVLFLIERERRRLILREVKGRAEAAAGSEGVLIPKAGKSVSDEVVKEVKNRLRVLDIEREILSYAIRRLYEAHAEGKITLEERESLALKYREDLERIKQEIARGESIIALNDLERMQEEFIKMFSEKIEVINRRIEELKAIAGLRMLEKAAGQRAETKATEAAERPEEPPAQQGEPEKQPAQRRQREAAKPKASEQLPEHGGEAGERAAEADKSIKQIMAEIEKVLSRLSQMEVEE